jgi:hypothetical protein
MSVAAHLRPMRPKTRARGYGGHHQALRDKIAPQVAAGVVKCARCGKPIAPGSAWDLGHDDHDRSRYNGPEHRACNRRPKPRRRQSREW